MSLRLVPHGHAADIEQRMPGLVIWRGSATATLSDKPEKDTKKLDKAVEKLFKDFPPHSS